MIKTFYTEGENRLMYFKNIVFYLKMLKKQVLWLLAEKNNKKGQVIVEYVLLLVVSTAMALVLINFARISPPGESLIFGYWEKLLIEIGADIST